MQPEIAHGPALEFTLILESESVLGVRLRLQH